MQIIKFWNKYHIYGQKIIILLLLLILTGGFRAVAQQRKTPGMNRGTTNLQHYDDRRFHYGFTIGFNSAAFRLTPSTNFLNTDTLISMGTPRSPGFSLGFVVNCRLAEFFDLRLLPTVSFYERQVQYHFKGRGEVDQISDNTFIELPLMLKYKSQRRRNTRMYLVGGAKLGIEAGSKKKDKKITELRTNNMDFAVEYGVGLDIYYPLFKFAPELRISHGLTNMLNPDPNQYARAVNVLLTHTVTLYLHFE